MIVSSAKELTNADGGALYIVEADHLVLSLLGIDSLNLDVHHPTAERPIPLYDAAGQANTSIAASYAVATGAPVNIPDFNQTAGVPVRGNQAFDSRYGYRSHSCLTVPLRNQEHEIIGVLQCFNARDHQSDSLVAFSEDDQRLMESLASQAAVALTRHRLLASLRRSEQRYRDVVEQSPGAICMHDLNGVLTFVNQALAQPLGYEPADMVGRHLGEFLAPKVRPELADYLQHCAQEHRASGHVPLLTKDGKERVLLYRSLCYEEAGKPPYVIGHAQDITEQRQLEMQLQQAQKMQAIGTLAGGIAHDFNNILTAIIGYSELVIDDIPPDSLARENVQEVLVAGHRAKDLVQQILTFSRQGDAERKPLALHRIVKEVLKLLRASLPTTIDIRVHLATTTGEVLANPTQMHQVLMNLGTNAGHAMKDTGGVLEVGLDTLQVDEAFVQSHPALKPGPYARLTVKDTGHGMPPEVLARIFEPFFTTKGVGEGTGMGLSVVHGIIISHGGNITVESDPGIGTTFTIYLPHIAPTAEGATGANAPIPGGHARILFVDDEVAIAGLAQQMLERLGYQVVVHTHSLAALEAFRVDPQAFDLVITDQTMPHLRGDHLVQELRWCRADIPIILCTGFSEAVHTGQEQALGVDAVCRKPLTVQNLGTTIHHVLTARGIRK
jgi:PAS domain S-box-containing protein